MSEAIGVAALGLWPGVEPLRAHQELLDVLGDPPSGLVGVPPLAVLPVRGPGAAMVGRTLALAESMPATLEPHGWRLGLVVDRELRAGRAWLARDVEALSFAAHGRQGPIALPVLGPWSLAAALWLPRGERAVADELAVRDLVASVASGLSAHLASVRRALPGADAVVLVHEPALAAVVRGGVSTFSGRGRLAAVSPAAVTSELAVLVEALTAVEARVVLCVPADATVLRAASGAAPGALWLDVAALARPCWEALAEAVESGVGLWAGIADAMERPPLAQQSSSLMTPWRALGLTARSLDDVVVTPGSRLDGLSPEHAQRALRNTVALAQAIGEQIA